MNWVKFLTATVVFGYADSSFHFSAAGACGIDEHDDHDVR
jgi:hypothetical protein